jgi:hypothetical protein
LVYGVSASAKRCRGFRNGIRPWIIYIDLVHCKTMLSYQLPQVPTLMLNSKLTKQVNRRVLKERLGDLFP